MADGLRAPTRILNVGLLAHVDAGKTTLTERLLYKLGDLRSLGSVDRGDTQTDWLPVERARGVSVRSSSVSIDYGGVRVNIIDTPGHFDFTGETERALSALDAAIVVVSALEGVQSQTELYWRALKSLKIPALIFVNKIDRAGCDPDSLLAALKAEFGGAIIALNRVVNPGDRGCGVVAARFSEDDLLELADIDVALADDYLSGAASAETNAEEEAAGGGDTAAGGGMTINRGRHASGSSGGGSAIAQALARQTRLARAHPLLFGSAATGAGIMEIPDAVVKYLPVANTIPEGDALGIVYKIEHDKESGKTAHVRMFSGTLRNRDSVDLEHRAANVSRNKISLIRKISGARRIDAGILVGGDIGAVYGLADARVWDILRQAETAGEPRGGERLKNEPRGGDDERGGSELLNSEPRGDELPDGERIKREPRGGGDERRRLAEKLSASLSPPLFRVQVTAPKGRESEVLRATAELTDEDPLLEYEYEQETRELTVNIMGKMQLEILESLFLERYGLAVRFSSPTVIYKETPAGRGVGLEAYTMPKPCWAVVRLAVEPAPRGAGYRFLSIIKANELPYKYQNHVELTVPETLRQGLYNWETVDINVTLTGGEHHHVHTHPMDFFLATPIAVMNALQNAGTTLLEPLIRARFSAPEEFTGRLLGDIIAMRGEFDSPVIKNGAVFIEATAPVAASVDYPARFASLTSGKGVIRIAFAGYRECPLELGAVARRRGVNPLDRMKWILYKRNAYSLGQT